MLLVGIAPVLAQVIGSLFNIWYNDWQLRGPLSAAQETQFRWTATAYNAVVYPIACTVWLMLLFSLRAVHRARIQREQIPAERLAAAQRKVINLPWILAGLGSISWLGCIPVFLLSLRMTGEPVDALVETHLVISFLIGGSIGVTQGFFAVDLASQRWLFPILFEDARPVDVPGTVPVTLIGRILLWTVAAVFCPIGCLLLLLLVPHEGGIDRGFAVAVAAVAVSFAVLTAWMFARFIQVPVHRLREAAARVRDGKLDTFVNLPRADDFGPLVDEFNSMVAGLREKEQLQETFGRHVGRRPPAKYSARIPDWVASNAKSRSSSPTCEISPGRAAMPNHRRSYRS